MPYISNTINDTTARWTGKTQPGLLEANVVGLGRSTSSYIVAFKNGGRSYEVTGPEGLKVGNAVSIGVYPGSAKKYMILQKARGGQTPVAQSVQV